MSLTVYEMVIGCEHRRRHLETSKHIMFYRFHTVQKKTKFTFHKNPFRFRFPPLILFLKRLIRFVNRLKINGFCRSLTHSSVIFENLRFVTELCPALLTPFNLHIKLQKWLLVLRQISNYNTLSLIELNLQNDIKPQKWCNNDIPTITQ